MSFFGRVRDRIHPRCPVAKGESGPYEYIQFSKDGELIFELPKSCMSFLNVAHAKEGQENAPIWLSVNDREKMLAHEHTIVAKEMTANA